MMSFKQLVEDARPRHKWPDHIDLAVLAEHAKHHRDESAKSFRYAVISIGIAVAIVFVGILFAAWHEQTTMTQSQQETVGRIIN